MVMTLKDFCREFWPSLVILTILGIGIALALREDARQDAACRDRGGVRQQGICFDPKMLK